MTWDCVTISIIAVIECRSEKCLGHIAVRSVVVVVALTD